MHVSNLSDFISDLTSNTLLLIPIEFGTVFALGVQRLETLEEQETQYSQALVKSERETVIAFCLPVFYSFFTAAIRSIKK